MEFNRLEKNFMMLFLKHIMLICFAQLYEMIYLCKQKNILCVEL